MAHAICRAISHPHRAGQITPLQARDFDLRSPIGDEAMAIADDQCAAAEQYARGQQDEEGGADGAPEISPLETLLSQRGACKPQGLTALSSGTGLTTHMSLNQREPVRVMSDARAQQCGEGR